MRFVGSVGLYYQLVQAKSGDINLIHYLWLNLIHH